MGAPKPPKPRTTIFDTRDDTLGDIPGPIRVDVIDDVIWACGGHTRVGMAYRYASGQWTASRLTMLPNFILGISATEAIVAGSSGVVARTRDGGATWTREDLGGAWMICASRDREGRVWMGQQGGRIWRAVDPRAPFERVAQVTGSVNTVRQMNEREALVVTEKAAHRIALATGRVAREPVHTPGAADMIDGAIDDHGRIVLVANGGRAWLADDGKTFAAIDASRTGRGKPLDCDAVYWIAPWWVVMGYDGALRVSLDGTTWKKVVVEPNDRVRRLGGIAAYRGGWLVGAARVDAAISGSLAYLGDPAAAPLLPRQPPADASEIPDLTFTIAERYALSWSTTWASLPGADIYAAGWMKLAGTLR